MRSESKRISRLYKSSIIRALFLDYCVQNMGGSFSQYQFIKDHESEKKLWFLISQQELQKEIDFLEKLGLIEVTKNKSIKLTDKGFSSVEKGVYWDRMKSLTSEVRLYRNQVITIVIASLSAVLSAITLAIKLMEK